jgi:uncharacterized membrane protein YfcA
MIVGTLVGAYVIGTLPQTFFFKLLTVICALGTLFFLALPLPIKEDNFISSEKLETKVPEETNVLTLFKNRNMQLFQPLILYSSVCIGIDAGVITILITNTMLSTEESKHFTEAE